MSILDTRRPRRAPHLHLYARLRFSCILSTGQRVKSQERRLRCRAAPISTLSCRRTDNPCSTCCRLTNERGDFLRDAVGDATDRHTAIGMADQNAFGPLARSMPTTSVLSCRWICEAVEAGRHALCFPIVHRKISPRWFARMRYEKPR
jgi:hypothetical protein